MVVNLASKVESAALASEPASGLAKTLKREWPEIAVNALDLGKDLAVEASC